jgi:hypothetical protein
VAAGIARWDFANAGGDEPTCPSKGDESGGWSAAALCWQGFQDVLKREFTQEFQELSRTTFS